MSDQRQRQREELSHERQQELRTQAYLDLLTARANHIQSGLDEYVEVDA